MLNKEHDKIILNRFAQGWGTQDMVRIPIFQIKVVDFERSLRMKTIIFIYNCFIAI